MSSDVKALRYLLAHNTALLAVVPADRIAAGVIAQDTTLPAIGIRRVDRQRRKSVSGAESQHFYTARDQVTVLAATYPELAQVQALIIAALPRKPGAVNGVAVDAVQPDVEGPDMSDSASGIYEQSLDYIVTYSE